jgi:hypothetical protein
MSDDTRLKYLQESEARQIEDCVFLRFQEFFPFHCNRFVCIYLYMPIDLKNNTVVFSQPYFSII